MKLFKKRKRILPTTFALDTIINPLYSCRNLRKVKAKSGAWRSQVSNLQSRAPGLWALPLPGSGLGSALSFWGI